MYCAERRVDGGVRFKIQLTGWLPCIESEDISDKKSFRNVLQDI